MRVTTGKRTISTDRWTTDLGLLRKLQAPVFELTLPFSPSANHRPRVSRSGHAYYAKDYRQWKEAVEEYLPTGDINITGSLVAYLEAWVQQPKSSKLTHPRQDCDNLVKGTLDAVTNVGGYWKDDSQVVLLVSRKLWCPHGEQPRTALKVWSIVEDTRG